MADTPDFRNLSLDEKRKIMVAVDFGTTYSGLAWAQTRKPRVQSIIQDWPGGSDSDEKVPTTLQYDDPDDRSSPRWGFEVDDTEPKYEWFKLGLDPGQERDTELAKKYPSANAFSRVDDEFCETLVVEYLTALRTHVEKVLEETLFDSILRSTPTEYIITVPAVWSHKAESKTRSCAAKAGMGREDRIRIISEPEAAAIYALHAMDPNGLHIDDTFVVCDAGGGTVDLVSYTVTALNPVPKVQEAATGSGRLCGAMFLDRIFAKFMKDKCGGNSKWDDEVLAEAIRDFDSKIKKKFDGDVKKDYFIRVGLANDRRAGIKDNKFRLSGTDVRDIFEPVISEILKLVMDQIRATKRVVTAVLLVGGFGRNAYLHKRVQAEVGRAISVKKVPNSWTAVVRGALMRSLADANALPPNESVKLDARAARRHYGTLVCVPLEPGHDQNRGEFHPLSGRYRISVMHWFLRKGALVKDSKPKVFSFYWDEKRRPLEIKMTIYSCEDPKDSGAPLYEDGSPNVTKLGVLKADVSGIEEDQLDKERGKNGEMIYKLDFLIEMAIHSGSITFTLLYKEMRCPPVDFRFE